MADEERANEAEVVRFPQSRVRPRGSGAPFKVLGFGLQAERLGASREQTTGHWCSRCRGIWFGYLLEVACPACGNRHG
jgi:hypothetical protein